MAPRRVISEATLIPPTAPPESEPPVVEVDDEVAAGSAVEGAVAVGIDVV
jgi:hypothetical protein